MRSTFKILFYVKRDRQKLNGNVPIMCRITIDKEATRFNTKLDISPALWDSKAARVIGKSNEAVTINDLLERTLASLSIWVIFLSTSCFSFAAKFILISRLGRKIM